jgi:type VI secretion system protein ImpH
MAASNWGTDCRLDESLFTSACEFEFFQAVRLLTLLRDTPRTALTGPSLDVVRFRAHNSLSFPASSIASVQNENGGVPSMAVTFLGMTGPQGALPAAYTELAIDRDCFGDHSFADFLDLFNHRLIQLFFESWKKHHFVVGYEQARRHQGNDDKKERRDDEFTEYLFDLIGMGTRNLRGKMPLADLGLLHYAGLLAQRPHSADALRAFLHDYFEVPATVEQFLGKWHTLETDELCTLGSGDTNSVLGGGAVAGDAIWSRQALVRIVFGPLKAEQFRSFLPNGKSFAQAAALVRWFLGSTLEFEIQATLQREEVPPCRLGDEASCARLGWSAWLRTEPFWFPATDTILREDELVTQEEQVIQEEDGSLEA